MFENFIGYLDFPPPINLRIDRWRNKWSDPRQKFFFERREIISLKHVSCHLNLFKKNRSLALLTFHLDSLYWKNKNDEEKWKNILLTCENVKKMQMKKEIQFIFDEGEDKRNEDDDSLKILVLWNCCFLLFHFFYLLLDGLRSNGRLNNFINTPIKRQKWEVEDDEDKKWVRSGRDWWLKWKKAPKTQSYNWNLYSSANFLTSLLSLIPSTLISINFPSHSPAFVSLLRWFEVKMINNFVFIATILFRIIMFLKSLNFSY